MYVTVSMYLDPSEQEIKSQLSRKILLLGTNKC